MVKVCLPFFYGGLASLWLILPPFLRRAFTVTLTSVSLEESFWRFASLTNDHFF
jgi:hypothetical protein